MTLFKKLLALVSSASSIETGVASCLGHMLEGNTLAGITDLLAMLDEESNGHPAVKAELAKIRSALAAAGLADAATEPAQLVAAEPEAVSATPS